MTVTIKHGDSRAVLSTVADASIDACVTDPPYSLVSIQTRFGKPGSAPVKVKTFPGQTGSPHARAARGFMGQQWDTGETAHDPDFWREVLRVLKPGAHLAAFAGTRTYHRMACAIEDAGFEIRDQIGWAYGSGFPKSHNLGNGWGTALKPAWEPICLARKPLTGTVAANVQEFGTGALNIDACRIATEESTARPAGINVGIYGADNRRGMIRGGDLGRWPANLCHDGSEEVMAAFPDAGKSPEFVTRGPSDSKHGSSNRSGELQKWPCHGDSGSAARFFYCAKADADDRCESKHPTVKPVQLMRWLVRLVTPPRGLVLDPFAGTGTTGIACIREGFDCMLVEREASYVADIRRRIDYLSGGGTPLFG